MKHKQRQSSAAFVAPAAGCTRGHCHVCFADMMLDGKRAARRVNGLSQRQVFRKENEDAEKTPALFVRRSFFPLATTELKATF